MGENTTGAPTRYLGTSRAAEKLDLSPSGLWFVRKNAEGWYRRAAEAGDQDAAVVLGVLLHARGELAEAETWLAQATAAGHHTAKVGLGFLCHRLGRTQEAEGWYRRAAEAGDQDAAVVLRVLLHARGELAEAETRLAHAAAAGHDTAKIAIDDADSAWHLVYRLGRIRDVRFEYDGPAPRAIPPLPAIVIHERKQGYPGWVGDLQWDKGAAVRIAQPETLVGVSAVAELLNRSRQRVRDLIKHPEFPPTQVELEETRQTRPGWRVDHIQSYAQHRNTRPGQAGWRSRRPPTTSPTSQHG